VDFSPRRSSDLPRLAIIVALFSLIAPLRAAAPDAGWLLPNFANRLSVEVRNPGKSQFQGLVTLPIVKAQAAAPEFPGRVALAVLVDAANATQQGAVIPSQTDDLDGDGNPDQFEFPATLAPGANCRVDVYYSTTLETTFPWPQRVSAKHYYGYNREVAALESELVGYRMYGGFFLDLHGRKAGNFGLWNDAAAYVPIRLDLGTGRDVLHIGATLGLGGVYLRRNGKVYQPPANVPTYAHKPSPEMIPHYRVVAQGPLRAIFEATLDHWQIDGDVIALRARYSIDAGERIVRCRVEAIPLQIAEGHEYEIGVGIRDLPAGAVFSAAGQAIVTGQQNARDGEVGLGLYFDAADYSKVILVPTADGSNQAVAARDKLRPGHAVKQVYAVAGAWGGSGIKNVSESLKQLQTKFQEHVETGELTFSRTPHPEKVDAEAQ
jgi:hypothetical protein